MDVPEKEKARDEKKEKKVKRMDDFDKWVCCIVTVLVAVIVWGVIMISLVTFRWLGVL